MVPPMKTSDIHFYMNKIENHEMGLNIHHLKDYTHLGLAVITFEFVGHGMPIPQRYEWDITTTIGKHIRNQLHRLKEGKLLWHL